ncbi:MAG: DUF1501 domain-containing protein [bacterium]|nr:DUF1501 domain-containing protein [bacterium]
MNNRFDRRNFLKKAGMFGCAALTFNMMPKVGVGSAWASDNTKLLILNLQGGCDGLSLFQPTSGGVYDTLNSLRPTLCVDPISLSQTADGYGFHPSLTTFKSLYDSGDLLSILGVGIENGSLSHADAEVGIARGVKDRLTPTASGFISRIGKEKNWSGLEAVSITGTDLAFSGTSFSAMQVNGLNNLKFIGDTTQSTHENSYRSDQIYELSKEWPTSENKPKFQELIKSIDLASNNSDLVQAALSEATFSQAYPNSSLGRLFKDAEVLLSATSFNSRVVNLRYPGYDTHSNQANVLLSNLNRVEAALSVFVSNMKTRGLWNNLIILVMSEFGRRNKENGSQGTEHGGANTFFLAGGPVNGGNIVGELTSSDLTSNSWLDPKYNVSEVYSQILAKMDLDPEKIIGETSGPSLAGILT